MNLAEVEAFMEKKKSSDGVEQSSGLPRKVEETVLFSW